MEETERKLFSSLSTISNHFPQSRQVAQPFLPSFSIGETDHTRSSKNFHAAGALGFSLGQAGQQGSAGHCFCLS